MAETSDLTDKIPDDVVISVRGVRKKFSRHLKRSMLYGIQDLTANLVGIKMKREGLRKSEFWALDDVNFELKRGECLGLIGPNGCGKTTLLRLMAGIFPPDGGEIAIRGRVGALIALGAGFHPYMSGRENIYLNASLLGMSREETDANLDDIIKFSEIEEAINAPVSTYSSGMRVRLGFAIAVHINPDVLLIDEVFAVGDLRFRSKCQEKISDLLDRCAIIFVSHQMSTVARICNRVIVMNRGKKVFDGNQHDGVNEYIEKYNHVTIHPRVLGSGLAELTLVRSGSESEALTCEHGAALDLKFRVQVDSAYDEFIVVVQFMGTDGSYLVQCHSGHNGKIFKNSGSEQTIALTIPFITLKPGRYFMTVLVYDKDNIRQLVHKHAICELMVRGGFAGSPFHQWQGDWAVKETGV